MIPGREIVTRYASFVSFFDDLFATFQLPRLEDHVDVVLVTITTITLKISLSQEFASYSSIFDS